jgi:sugar lactone lactonase YvrE
MGSARQGLFHVSADKTWEQVGETYRSVASPAGDKDGNVFFADPAANRIYKSDADRKVTVFKENSNGARALRVGPDSRLYASQPARQRIVSYGPGGEEKVVAQNVEATDLAISAKGAIYFTDATRKTLATSMRTARRAWHMAEVNSRSHRVSLSPPIRRCWS